MRQSRKRILLGDKIIRFQWVGCLDFNWTALHVGVYIYNIYKSFQPQPTPYVIENFYILILGLLHQRECFIYSLHIYTQFWLRKFNFCQIAQNEQRVPAELPGFWTITLHLGGGGGRGGAAEKRGPKLLTSQNVQAPTHHFTCRVQWDNSKSRNKVLITEIHHCQNTRHVIWTISMFIAYTLSKVQ
jgi:hypothetical protein